MHQGKPSADEHVDAFPRALGPRRASDGQHVAFRLRRWPFAGPHGGVHARQKDACVQTKHGLDARLNVGRISADGAALPCRHATHQGAVPASRRGEQQARQRHGARLSAVDFRPQRGLAVQAAARFEHVDVKRQISGQAIGRFERAFARDEVDHVHAVKRCAADFA